MRSNQCEYTPIKGVALPLEYEGSGYTYRGNYGFFGHGPGWCPLLLVAGLAFCWYLHHRKEPQQKGAK